MDPIVEIFAPGEHMAHSGAVVEITSADLAATVAAYDPALAEAPVVVGRPAAGHGCIDPRRVGKSAPSSDGGGAAGQGGSVTGLPGRCDI